LIRKSYLDKMKGKKIVFWTGLTTVLVLGLTVYTIIASTHTIDQRREDIDTTYFTGSHPGYEPALRAAIMKTGWYRKFRNTRKDDSLGIYLKLAEEEGLYMIKKK